MNACRRGRAVIAGLAAACASGALLTAQIFFSDTVTISFEPGKAPVEAEWSPSMELTPRGLATLQPWAPNTSRDFWIRTQPLPTGPSWRPPANLKLTLTFTGVETVADTMRPYARAYVRYSTDRVHWSSWVAMSPNMNVLPMPAVFEVQLMLPNAARARYHALMTEWARTNPAWASDEHEFCLWLAARHRDLFDSEIPVIGYAQVLVEGGAQGLRLGGLSVKLGSSGSGLEVPPRGERRPSADQNWFFDLSKIR